MFYQKIQQTPYKIKLEVVTTKKTTDSEEFSLESFVGDSPRESKFYEFRCLYEKDIADWSREKYGLPKEVNGVVYLSPKQIVPKLGTLHPNWNAIKVHFEGSVQVIHKVIYLEEFVEYGSCVGIQIFIKDSLKGG